MLSESYKRKFLCKKSVRYFTLENFPECVAWGIDVLLPRKSFDFKFKNKKKNIFILIYCDICTIAAMIWFDIVN